MDQKKAYQAPELTVYGSVEQITSTKTWQTTDDWIGQVVDFMTPLSDDRLRTWNGS